MKTLKKTLTGILLTLSLSSCYSVQLQSSFNDEIPASMSDTYPTRDGLMPSQSNTQTRHFTHTFHQWYVVGLVPYDLWNSISPDSQGLEANQYVDFVLKKEAQNAVAVKNLKITTAHDANGFVYSLLVGLIPALGPIVNGNLAITIEGDVVEATE